MNKFIPLCALFIFFAHTAFAQAKEEKITQGMETKTTVTTYKTVTTVVERRMTKEELAEYKRQQKAKRQAYRDSMAVVRAKQAAERQRHADSMAVVRAKQAAERQRYADSMAVVRAEQAASRQAAAALNAATQAEQLKARQQAADEAARLKAERAAALAAERKAKRAQINNEYNEKYRNRGVINSIEFSYLPQSSVYGDVIYTNLGHRQYGNLHPVEFDYMIGYRFSNYFALNLGIGVMLNGVNLASCGDTFSSVYGDVKYKSLNIPLFANVRTYLSRGKVQPMIMMSLGAYTASGTFLFDIGAGLNFRLSKRSNFYFTISAKTTPWPVFYNQRYYGYKAVFAPSFKIGITL